MIAGILNQLSSKLDHLLWTQQWYLLYRAGTAASRQLAHFQAIVPPQGTLWADPFIVAEGNRRFVFFEELRYRFWGRSTGTRGRLRAMEYLGGDQWGVPFPVLERGYHLSYPFVFSHCGQHYLIPESMANRTVELYRASEFPRQWEFSRSILKNVEAVDTTLCEHEGKWWMFTCLRDPASGLLNRDLHLFSTDDPVHGEWRPHPTNPVVSDLRHARPAGRIFSSGGTLYRPAQDCSTAYGAAIEIRRITRLDEHGYAEEPVERITADGLVGADGVHTWNHAAGLAVADARRKVGRWNLC